MIFSSQTIAIVVGSQKQVVVFLLRVASSAGAATFSHVTLSSTR